MRTEEMRVFMPQEENILITVENYDYDGDDDDVEAAMAYAEDWNGFIREHLDNNGLLTATVTWYPSYEEQAALIHISFVLIDV